MGMDYTPDLKGTQGLYFLQIKKKSLRPVFNKKDFYWGFWSKIEDGYQNKFSRPFFYPKYVFRVN